MTDAELIAQLRRSKGWPTLGHAAADRIEALAALHQAAVRDALAAEAYAEELEAKLAKAVKLAADECPFRYGTKRHNDWWYDRSITLAELKGQDDE